MEATLDTVTPAGEVPFFELPSFTQFSDYSLTLVRKVREAYGKLGISMGLITLPDDDLRIITVELYVGEAAAPAVSIWFPVKRSGEDNVYDLKQARADALSSALELLMAGAPTSQPIHQKDVTPIVTGDISALAPKLSLDPTSLEVTGFQCDDCRGPILPYQAGSHTVDAAALIAFTQDRWKASLCVACSNARNRKRISN